MHLARRHEHPDYCGLAPALTKPVSAVAFDYGCVLSGPQDPAQVARMHALVGIGPEEFESRYRADRLAHDRGTITGQRYWTGILRAGHVVPSAGLIAELIAADTASWMGKDERMVGWARQLVACGIQVAILSNMPAEMRAPIAERHAAWLSGFPLRLFSCDVGYAKPDPEIYKMLLDGVHLSGDRVLFLDDNAANVEGARRAGLRAILYTTYEALRLERLEELGLPQAE